MDGVKKLTQSNFRYITVASPPGVATRHLPLGEPRFQAQTGFPFSLAERFEMELIRDILPEKPYVTAYVHCYRRGQKRHSLLCWNCEHDMKTCRDSRRYEFYLPYTKRLQSLAVNGFEQPMLEGLLQSYKDFDLKK